MHGFECAPLCLYFLVELKLRVTFPILKSHLLENRHKVVEQESVDSLALVFGLHAYQQQIEHTRTLDEQGL